LLRAFYNKILRPIFTINDTPHAVALGVSLGVFIGLTPTVGYQIALALIIGTFLKANRIIAVLVTWIANPITALPMYYTYYWLGCKLMGTEVWGFNTFAPKITQIWRIDGEAGLFARVAMVFSELASEIGLPLFIGSIVIAFTLSIPLYPLTRWALLKKRKASQEDPSRCAEGEGGGGKERGCAAGEKEWNRGATLQPDEDKVCSQSARRRK